MLLHPICAHPPIISHLSQYRDIAVPHTVLTLTLTHASHPVVVERWPWCYDLVQPFALCDIVTFSQKDGSSVCGTFYDRPSYRTPFEMRLRPRLRLTSTSTSRSSNIRVFSNTKGDACPLFLQSAIEESRGVSRQRASSHRHRHRECASACRLHLQQVDVC